MANSKKQGFCQDNQNEFWIITIQMFKIFNNICCLLMTIEHGLTKAVWSMSPH